MVTSDEFSKALLEIFRHESSKGKSSIIVNSGELHRMLGGYPGRDHRMPICCNVMRKAMTSKDRILSEPPKGSGASLTIKYMLPRQH